MTDDEASFMATMAFVARAMDDLVDTLGEVPLDALKHWVQRTKTFEAPTEDIKSMQNGHGHVDIIEAYIKMREYAQRSVNNNIRNS